MRTRNGALQLLPKPLLLWVNIAQCDFAQVDFCPIGQVPFLAKCLYCPSNLIAQVSFSCIIAQENKNRKEKNLLESNKIY